MLSRLPGRIDTGPWNDMGTDMMRHRLARPSLRIIERNADPPARRLSFEVWNPFAAGYQSVASVQEGLRRVGELAALIGRMWARQHPKLALLEDVAGAGVIRQARWAEMRINPTTQHSYDTRQDNDPAWAPAAGMAQATQIVCTRVGCEPDADLAGHGIASDAGMEG